LYVTLAKIIALEKGSSDPSSNIGEKRPLQIHTPPDVLGENIDWLWLVTDQRLALEVPVFVWIIVEVVRSIRIEEKYLMASLPGYGEYQRVTGQVIPFKWK
jgi:hypothetical protein